MNREIRADYQSREEVYTPREIPACAPTSPTPTNSLPLALSRETEQRLRVLGFAQSPNLREAFKETHLG